MFRWLYNFSIRSYAAFIYVLSPFNTKAKKWISGRRNWVDVIHIASGENEMWIWFHCSSLGEFEDCCEVFSEIKLSYPKHKILLTFYSPSGYEVLKNSPEFDLVMYLPHDYSQNVKQFLNILQPESIFFARSEIWLNYLQEIRKRQIPVFLIAFKMNSKSGFLKSPAKQLYKTAFQNFTHIYCQDKQTVQLLQDNFQIEHTTVIGNTRFERIHKEFLVSAEFPAIQSFTEKHYTIIVGSYLPNDLQKILPIIPKFIESNGRIILVPHEIECRQIGKLEVQFGNQIIRYSNIHQFNGDHKIVLIDRVGILKHLYRYGNLAIIGGGFNKIGIHNIIEPAMHGLITLYGPNHRNYQEALDLTKMGASFIYRNENELLEIIDRLRTETEQLTPAKIQEYVTDNKTNSKEIVQLIQRHLS